MTEDPSKNQLPVSSDFERVAIVDDIFLGPKLSTVTQELPAFCAFVESEDTLSDALLDKTGCNFCDAGDVNEQALYRLHKERHHFNEAKESLATLFTDHDQRLGDVERVIFSLKEMGFDPQRFGSVEGLFKGDRFNLVFLDYYLTDDNESLEIAKELFTKFRSFIILMSDKPQPEEYHTVEEDFRQKSCLLRGFFSFFPKSTLTDPSGLEHAINLLPQNAKVCQSVQSFVDAIDRALGGPLPEFTSDNQTSNVLTCFIRTLRSLALHDYAMLCELTLRDEGEPLGDYTVRLLGALLTQKLLSDTNVREAVQHLDGMRFDEFLPCANEASESLREIYAASIFETISSPWSPHPWETDQVEGEGAASHE